MDELNKVYKNIRTLCDKNGLTDGGFCAAIGKSRNFMQQLKTNPDKTITLESAQIIADFFGVPVDAITGEEKEAPVLNDECFSPTMKEIFESVADLDEEQLKKLLKIINTTKDVL